MYTTSALQKIPSLLHPLYTFLCGLIWIALSAPTFAEPPKPRTVEVDAQAEIEVMPDVVDLTLQISTTKKTPKQAIDALNQKVKQSAQALQKAGLPTKDLSYSYLRIYPKYRAFSGTGGIHRIQDLGRLHPRSQTTGNLRRSHSFRRGFQIVHEFSQHPNRKTQTKTPRHGHPSRQKQSPTARQRRTKQPGSRPNDPRTQTVRQHMGTK